jgi:hypothetical protein
VGPSRPLQLSFPFIEPVGVLAVVNMTSVTHRRFVEFIGKHRPQLLFDIRPIPAFNMGPLSRQSVFALFNDAKTSYHDMAGMLEVVDDRELATASASLAAAIMELIDEAELPPRRLGVLSDDSQAARWVTRQLLGSLGTFTWRVTEVSA